MRTIKTKLVLGYLLVLLTSIYIFAGYFYYRVKTNLLNTSQEFLQHAFDDAVQYLEMSDSSNINDIANYLSKSTAIRSGPYQIFFAIFDGEGHVLAKTQEFLDRADQVQMLFKQGKDSEVISTSSSEYQRHLLLITGNMQTGNHESFVLQFALESPHDSKMLRSLKTTMFLAVPLVTMLAFAGGVLLTNRVMSHLVKITKSAKKISLTQTQHRLPLSGTDDELDDLAKTINAIFDQMKASYDRQTRFASDASHELRLPITAIKGEAEVVLERERSIEEYQKTFESMIEEMERLEKILNALLLLTRADSLDDMIEKQDIDITQSLKKLLDFYDILAREKEISCKFISHQNIVIKGDETALSQLFSNLIENAIKYTPHNGEISVECSVKDTICSISVADNGIGIAKEHHMKIFDRFYRVDKGRARYLGGAGLGLSICQHIVQSHHGHIFVESEVGKGSRFIIELPVSSK